MFDLLLTVILLILLSNGLIYVTNIFKISPILGLLLLGVISSTNYLKNFIEPNKLPIEYLGDLGIISLMFIIGYETSLKKLKKNKKDTIIIALICFIIPFILGFSLFYYLKFNILTCFIVGLVLAITAEAINGKILLELDILDTDVGSTIIGIGLIDDLLGIFILAFLMIYINGIKKDCLLSIIIIVSFFLGLKYKQKIEDKTIFLQEINNKKNIEKFKDIGIKVLAPFFFINMGLNLDLSNLIIRPNIIFLLISIAILGKVGGSLVSKPFVDYSLKQLNIIGWGVNSRGAVDLTIALLSFRNGLIKKNIYSALAITILFGSGGGCAILFAGASLPLMLDKFGTSAWPFAWLLIGGASLFFLPFSLWAAKQLKTDIQKNKSSMPFPIRRLFPITVGYGCFGFGYIVYLTFLSAWMKQTSASPVFIAVEWILLGMCITVSPFVWRHILARYDSGFPLACVLVCIAVGSALPILLPSSVSLIFSAIIFGISVFMAPSAIASFTHKNLPPESWGRQMSLFTVIFAATQTVGPYAAGLIGDYFDNIGVSLLFASIILLLGAAFAFFQKPILR